MEVFSIVLVCSHVNMFDVFLDDSVTVLDRRKIVAVVVDLRASHVPYLDAKHIKFLSLIA